MARKTLAELAANPPTFSTEERARLAAMTDDAIDQQADLDPINPTMTDEALDRAVFARAVREAREQVGLTQPVFAERYHISLSRLRDWERGRYKPDSVATAYIKTIRHNPLAVERALKIDD
ncbi:DNA-binding transcriptional regulator [Beijerinckia sp. L45]|uniref:helix-turn-helix domain-containing protein n=1 Tax=Beijerinckia sp. L45 TaxID=1641855 RepID=UPI00131E89B4|nr:helix-turn-helix domain-containing protein [Beijerinckia sp. L45]